jgi:signal peptidase I
MAIGGRQKEEGFWASTWDTIKTLIYAVLIAMVFRTVLIEPFSIPSGSMKPTLLEGDYLFVTKYSYGYSRFSMPFSPPLWDGRIFYNPPKRGDVVVFRLPSDNKTDYIKRIIGLPGDRVQVINGILHINGEAVKRSESTSRIDTNMDRLEEYVETLPGGFRHSIWERSDNHLPGDNTRVHVVPLDHFFAMGDNRDNSADSRFPEVGPVPAENLIGRAEFVFFSHNTSAKWWQVWRWPAAIRWGRIFQSID